MIRAPMLCAEVPTDADFVAVADLLESEPAFAAAALPRLFDLAFSANDGDQCLLYDGEPGGAFDRALTAHTGGPVCLTDEEESALEAAGHDAPGHRLTFNFLLCEGGFLVLCMRHLPPGLAADARDALGDFRRNAVGPVLADALDSPR